MKFLHVMIRVKNIQKSLDFYTNLLEMNLVRTLELDDSRLYYLSDKDGQTQIELTENFQTPQEGYSLGNAFGHFAFSVDSFDNFYLKMQKLGIDWLYEPFFLPDNDIKIAFIQDPDGYEIELIQE